MDLSLLFKVSSVKRAPDEYENYEKLLLLSTAACTSFSTSCSGIDLQPNPFIYSQLLIIERLSLSLFLPLPSPSTTAGERLKKMKEESHLHHQSLLHLKKIQLQHLLSPKKLNSATTYLFFFAVAYALGFLSSYTIIQQTTPHLQSPPQPHVSDSELFRFNSTCADPVPSKLVRQTLLDRLFNGSSPFDAFPPPHAVPLLRQKRIKGWGSTGAVFETLIRRVKPRTIVEVGSFLGASAIHMAELTRRLGLNTQILCIDDFRGWPGFRDRFRDIKMVNGDVMLMYQFMQNVAQSNFTEVILPVPFSSGSALAQLCDLGVYADLIEVDAGHDFHSAWADINRAHTILRPGGVIFGHDYFTAADNRGVRRAVNLFAKVKGLKVIPHGQHWVLA